MPAYFLYIYLAFIKLFVLIKQAQNINGNVKEYIKGANRFAGKNFVKIIIIELSLLLFSIIAFIIYYLIIGTNQSYSVYDFLLYPFMFGLGIFALPSYYLAYNDLVNDYLNNKTKDINQKQYI
jgi:hypothetical protein